MPQEQPDFVNRERELDLLDMGRLRASRSPYLLLSAPAGLGKTYLLRQILQNIQEDRASRARWTVRYVELGGSQPQDALSMIVQSITDQPAEGDVAALVDRVCDHIVHKLAGPVEEENRRAVLLVLDGIEQLPKAARQWLYSLLYRLYRRTRIGNQEAVTVRIILAGHNVEQFWEECEQTCPVLPAPQRMDLGPLDQHAIEELIWNQARSIHTVLDDLTARQIADHIWYLSGGHPKAIRSLAADLAGRLFLVGPVTEYYAINQERLVKSCLLVVAKELLQNLDHRLRRAVQALSVLRRVNANSVQALVRAGELPKGTNEIRLLGDLQRAHVLVGPSIAEPFYHDRFMRRVFVLDLAHRSRASKARFRRLNAVALDLYAGWIRDVEPRLQETHLRSAQRLFAAVEWLYHALQEKRRPVEEIRAEFQALVAVLSQSGRDAAPLIAGELRRDAEVGYLLRCRIGEEGVDVACRWVREDEEPLDPARIEGGG